MIEGEAGASDSLGGFLMISSADISLLHFILLYFFDLLDFIILIYGNWNRTVSFEVDPDDAIVFH